MIKRSKGSLKSLVPRFQMKKSHSKDLIHLKVQGSENPSLVSFLHQSHLGDYSKKQIKKALEAKACRVNGSIETFASRKLQSGDELVFNLASLGSKKLTIIYEDDYFLAIDKPPFSVVDQTVFCRMLSMQCFVVHRLDKETSGLLLLAKTEETKKTFETLFYKRKIEKRYLTLVKGKVNSERGVIDEMISVGEQLRNQKIMRVGEFPGAQQAKTAYELLDQKGGVSLLRCTPHTGRTHQIRVHLASIGLSILGDQTYGRAKELANRMMLHAHELIFAHPTTGEKLHLKAPLPLDFQDSMRRWGISL